MPSHQRIHPTGKLVRAARLAARVYKAIKDLHSQARCARQSLTPLARLDVQQNTLPQTFSFSERHRERQLLQMRQLLLHLLPRREAAQDALQLPSIAGPAYQLSHLVRPNTHPQIQHLAHASQHDQKEFQHAFRQRPVLIEVPLFFHIHFPRPCLQVHTARNAPWHSLTLRDNPIQSRIQFTRNQTPQSFLHRRQVVLAQQSLFDSGRCHQHLSIATNHLHHGSAQCFLNRRPRVSPNPCVLVPTHPSSAALQISLCPHMLQQLLRQSSFLRCPPVERTETITSQGSGRLRFHAQRIPHSRPETLGPLCLFESLILRQVRLEHQMPRMLHT